MHNLLKKGREIFFIITLISLLLKLYRKDIIEFFLHKKMKNGILHRRLAFRLNIAAIGICLGIWPSFGVKL